jgi:hypothetical protein
VPSLRTICWVVGPRRLMAAGLWVPVSVGLAPTVADDDIGVGGVADGCLLSGVKQTSHFKGVTTVFDPKLCENSKNRKTTRIIFRKSIATEQAREVSTTRKSTWWNAHSTPSQRRPVFTRPRPLPDLSDALVVMRQVISQTYLWDRVAARFETFLSHSQPNLVVGFGHPNPSCT